MIAVEDIGIADIGLVQEVSRIATDKALRAVLSSDADLIDDLCTKMAASIKDRSADYLYSAATNLGLEEQAKLKSGPVAEQMTIASSPEEPISRKAMAALIACTSVRGTNAILRADRVEELLEKVGDMPDALRNAVLSLSRMRAHPFCILLPLIWLGWSVERASSEVVADQMPASEFYEGIPLYTFDKHTAAGKQAIAKLAHHCLPIRNLLSKQAHRDCWAEVIGVAAFYADAAPVAHRLAWPTGSRLAETGFMADMVAAGCRPDGAVAVLNCVISNLADLNQFRRATAFTSEK